MTTCPDCRGVGSAVVAFHGHTQHEDETCPRCGGTGMGVEHYEPGERVEVWQVGGRWSAAVVEKDAPYPKAHCGGAYVYHLPTGSGYGWIPQNQLRRVGSPESAPC